MNFSDARDQSVYGWSFHGAFCGLAGDLVEKLSEIRYNSSIEEPVTVCGSSYHPLQEAAEMAGSLRF